MSRHRTTADRVRDAVAAERRRCARLAEASIARYDAMSADYERNGKQEQADVCNSRAYSVGTLMRLIESGAKPASRGRRK